ncbi:GcrA cell cycle regulator [Kaistia dalseonensis]|uniref:GcrA cell cycle regulator n=1 Tax=Kaistia dalseonensis TaxID=410840 RepID=A0ABU0HDK6_9HYPH|nr:GcrA family cell cycle regulator [Kaistia dalseonensis]MCX5497764.1 GcrA cell cycle regulator [Kaistia dalseonensis]MDQ0440408.1 GcrA cell cycle regulator [Kaistia dalseonensis]
MTWTDERVELLKKLWIDGLSASQIATELGGVTRNAVIGKVHRLSLSGRAKPASTPVARARKPSTTNGRSTATSRPATTIRPMVAGNTALKPVGQLVAEPRRLPRMSESDDVVVPISLHATILTLTEQTCKWPIGDPNTDGFHFCGCNSKIGVPYCDYHARIAYQPVHDRRRERKVVGA